MSRLFRRIATRTQHNIVKPVANGSFTSQAYEAAFDQEELAEARKWHSTFNQSKLPRGETTFSRSSGPGGQHVNKTESKATTTWTIDELSRCLPRILQRTLVNSKYYARRNDSISIQAQTQRSRSANADDNRRKLLEEIQRIYRENVPGMTTSETKKKHAAFERAAHENRIKEKKQHSAKKASRRAVTE